MMQKILFVDDEVEMCFMVSNLLRQHGYEVITAETVEVVLQLAGEIPLSVIILDVNLAGEDGLKLVPFLRRNHPYTPIILYTGMEHDDATVQKAIENGANEYLRKGGPTHELTEAVRRVLGVS